LVSAGIVSLANLIIGRRLIGPIQPGITPFSRAEQARATDVIPS